MLNTISVWDSIERRILGIACWLCLPALGISGCKECDAVGCLGGLGVVFSTPLIGTETYTFTASATGSDAGPLSCSIAGTSERGTCDGTLGIVLDYGGGKVDGFHIYNFAPDSLTIEVRKNDEIIREATVKPTYEISQPNGPECPPTCRGATITL